MSSKVWMLKQSFNPSRGIGLLRVLAATRILLLNNGLLRKGIINPKVCTDRRAAQFPDLGQISGRAQS